MVCAISITSLNSCLHFWLFFVPCLFLLLFLLWCQLSESRYFSPQQIVFVFSILTMKRIFTQLLSILTTIDDRVWERISLTFPTHGSGGAQICPGNTICPTQRASSVIVFGHTWFWRNGILVILGVKMFEMARLL